MTALSRRRAVDAVARQLCAAATLVAVVPLALVLAYVAVRGLGGISLEFFSALPAPVGESGGGMGNAIQGSAILLGIACAIGIPVGVLAGVYLSEFGDGGWLERSTRFAADLLSGVPSIVVGIFVYGALVLTMGRFSAVAGGVALGILMLPTVTRTTEELLRMIPDSLREASLALGVPRWRTILSVVLPSGAAGIATGVMLAISRVAGETAPLLFTALGSQYWSRGLDQPTASLPVQIYTYAVSPYPQWHEQAWAAALVLVGFVLVLNVGARLVLRPRTETR